MAVRTPSMDALIAKVALLINDSSHTVFTTQQTQDALDRHRTAWRQAVLVEQPTLTSGSYAWLDYYADDPTAPTGDWEANETLYDNTFTAISGGAYTADELTGHWLFTASQPPPVYLTGLTYDVYAAAADLLEAWAAKVALAYDVSSAGRSLHRAQQREGLLAVAAQYRALQRVGRMQAVRSDIGGNVGRDLWVAQHTIDRGTT